jgi:DNA-binding beta-propeller fold protein YncE
MNGFVRVGLILLMVSLSAVAEVPGFKLAKKYPVSGDGFFDYIVFDASSNRLYISHGNAVDVLDADSGKRLGKIENTPSVHGIAIVPGLHRGFTSNGGDSTISVFDTNTFKTVKKLSVAKGPDFIFYDPLTKRVLVCHEDAAAITALDPEKGAVIGKIDLGGGPEAAVVNGKGTGFVNLEARAMVVSFDPQGLTVKQRWPIPGCKAPVPLAVDISNSRLFIGCRSNKVLAVMNADSGKVITTLPIGESVDGIVFDADNKMIFASNSDGNVSVIRQKSANEYESVGTIKTQKTAKTMAFDPKTKRLFLSAAETVESPGKGTTDQTRFKPGTFSVLVVERQ